MAADLMAIGVVPVAEGMQPAATASPMGTPAGGEAFADVIAAAMATDAKAATPPADVATDGLGIDVPGLLAAMTGTPDSDAEVPGAKVDGSRLDRDAEAEGLQGALASMLLGAWMRPAMSPPLQAMPGLAAPAVVTVTPAAMDGGALAGLTAIAAVEAQGGAPVAAAEVTEPTVATESTESIEVIDVAALTGETPVAPAVAERAAAAPMAYVAAAVVAAPVVSATLGEQVDALALNDLAVPPAPAAESGSSTASMALTPAPVPQPQVATADAGTAVRTLEVAVAEPVERRTDDGASAVVGANGVRMDAPVAASNAAPADVVVAVTDGRSLASAVADSVQLATLRGDREMTLTLNPPDLGHLSVHITEDAGGMRIAIHASSSEAHDLLQQHLPALRSGLEQRDVRVDQLQVDQQAPSSGLDWTSGDRRESSRRDGNDDGQPQWSPLAALRRSAEAATAGGAPISTRSSAVDVRA